MNKVCVIGLGYIGLPTAAIIADKGLEVIGVDINHELISSIKKLEVNKDEPGLEFIINKVIKEGKLIPTTKIQKADIFIIAVPTPLKLEKDKEPAPNMDFVYGIAEQLSGFIEEGNMVIIESTSTIGTTAKVADLIEYHSGISKNNIDFICCPERVIPGNIIHEIVHNDRIVGGLTSNSTLRCKEFYELFCNGKIHQTDSKTAELAKLTENSFRDVNIAFANEISIICEKLNINTDELIKLTNCHPRVNLLNPGCGVGGHCIAVDPYFITSQFPKDTLLIQSSRKVNEKKKEWSFRKIKEFIGLYKNEYSKDPIIGCLGLTYKANVDDIRNSPSLDIVKKLSRDIYKLKICEPNLKSHKKFKLENIKNTISKSDILIIFVAHKEFFPYVSEIVKDKKYIDFCGITNL